MAETKSRPTDASVEAFLDAVEPAGRREDGKTLRQLMERATGWPATMWGPSIVGFGRYRYRYDSGHEGEMCRIGFSPRKGDLVLYIHRDFPGGEDLVGALGKVRTSKGCIYASRLSDLRLPALEQLVARSLADIAARYPD